MKQQHILDAISALSPREFENFTYDCLSASGLKNMVWRTPGADGGRDIEGLAYARDLSGHETVQKWLDGKSKKIKISLLDQVTQNKVNGHPELIRQVLMNIFDNCIKYGAFNSVIEVKQWVQSNTDMAIITVKGLSQIAIVPDEMARIFDLGFRGSNARKIVASGTGLGLYICKKIIEQDHRGTLQVQADGPKGILFIIKLPLGRRG